MSVSRSFLRQPSLIGRFFSQSFNYLLTSRSAIFRFFSSSLNVKISSSDGILNGLSLSRLDVAVCARSFCWLWVSSFEALPFLGS
jgi:hypothetical protein